MLLFSQHRLRARVRRVSGRFHRDRSGAVVIVFALTLIPILMASLLSIDFARMTSTERWLQAAVDSAVLAGVSSNESNVIGVAERFFQQNTSAQKLPGLQASFSLAKDGTLSGTAEAQLPLVAGAIIQMSTVTLDVTASARRPVTKYQSFSFLPTAAQGVFNKDVFVVTRDAKGKVIKSELALRYSYNTKTGAKTTSPALGVPITVSLGQYETVALMMRVWWQNWGTRTGAYEDYYSDDKAPKIQTSGKCETGQTNNWEDGGDTNYKDFVYTMTCKAAEVSGAPHLVQ